LHRSDGIRRVIIDTIWEFRWNKNDFFFHETIEKSKSPTRGGGGTRARTINVLYTSIHITWYIIAEPISRAGLSGQYI